MPRGMHPNSRKALEEHRNRLNTEKAQKAAAKSVESRRAKRTFREEFEAELEAEIIQRDSKGNETGRTTVKNAITKTAVQKALKGDMRALEFIRDTIGEKPAENIILTQPDFSTLDEVEFDEK